MAWTISSTFSWKTSLLFLQQIIHIIKICCCVLHEPRDFLYEQYILKHIHQVFLSEKLKALTS